MLNLEKKIQAISTHIKILSSFELMFPFPNYLKMRLQWAGEIALYSVHLSEWYKGKLTSWSLFLYIVLNVRFSVLHHGVREMHTQSIRTEAVTPRFWEPFRVMCSILLYIKSCALEGRSGHTRRYQSRLLKSLRYWASLCCIYFKC